MEFSFENIEILLLVAAVVAILARRLRIPYTIGLVIAGIGLSLLAFFPTIQLTKDLIFQAFLPPLIFEAALYIPWKELRRDALVIVALATLGVALAAGLMIAGMHYLVAWDWKSAVMFGVLIAATDPVSVIATFKELGVQKRLRLLVEAESLFNDSTVAVAFSVALTIVMGGSLTAVAITETLILTILGGVLCGLLVGGGMLLLAGQTDDHLAELAFTTVAAYGSFLLAEHFHLSGILASLAAGMLIGNTGHLGSLSDRGREAVDSFWEFAAFVSNSLIFVLIGIHGVHQAFGAVLPAALVAIVLAVVGRAVAVYASCFLFSRSQLRVAMAHQHILFWGGLRGALALALALGLPPDIPRRDEIITVAFTVVAFSIFVQGLTITPLLHGLSAIEDETPPPP